MLFKGSRYAKVDIHEISNEKGRVIRYMKVRFIPETRAREAHTVRQEERLDHIAHTYFRDPERFWRICDANCAMWPDDLVRVPGKMILIPPSEG